MSKNLRNIIREEINDFDWIGEVSTGIEVGACFKYTSNAGWQGLATAKEMLEIEAIAVRKYHTLSHENYEVQSIEELNSDDHENTTVYFINTVTRRVYTIRLSELIEELESGELVMC